MFAETCLVKNGSVGQDFIYFLFIVFNPNAHFLAVIIDFVPLQEKEAKIADRLCKHCTFCSFCFIL